MVAEIGLPPGADVNRESLDRTGVSYQVRPDRVVFYVWPSADTEKIVFDFRVRYRMEARASASILYDYYNPESYAVVRPALFTVF